MTLPLRALKASALLLVTSVPLLGLLPSASAHHLMESSGQTTGFWPGLLSGLAHPVLGPDHLLFLLAIGLVGLHRPLRWIPLLLCSGLIGSMLGWLAPGLPLQEALVALSLVLVALVLQRDWDTRLLLPAMALHGYVLSATVIGWESTALGAYVLGLLLTQSLLLLGATVGIRRWSMCLSSQALSLISGVLMGVGGAFAWASLVG